MTRTWALWTQDQAILDLLAILHPDQPVEQTSNLLVYAAREGGLGCQEAADLYDDIFRGTLGLWTAYSVACRDGTVTVQSATN